MTRPPVTTAAACRTDLTVPGCDTGPAGRLTFVWREARAAWLRRRDRSTTATTPSATADDRPSTPRADGRPDLPLGGTR